MDTDYEQRKAAYLKKFATLPDEEKRLHQQVIIQMILEAIERIKAKNLEDMPVRNQAEIDATFYELMDGINFD